jgi:hypothetical protein
MGMKADGRRETVWASKMCKLLDDALQVSVGSHRDFWRFESCDRVIISLSYNVIVG